MGKITVEKPRVSEYKIDPPPRPFDKIFPDIKSVKLKILDINEKKEDDFDNGRGFYITDENMFVGRDGNERNINSIVSPLYCPDTISGDDTDKRYKCRCGAIDDPRHEGDICDICHSEVTVYKDIMVTGYIPLGKYRAINPTIYLHLLKIIGKTRLPAILKYKPKLDIKGAPMIEFDPKNPFDGIGMVEFKERFNEIIAYYLKKRKDYKENVDVVYQYSNAIFTPYVNVYNLEMRPVVKGDSKMTLFKVNKLYNKIVSNSNIVNSSQTNKLIIETALFSIQQTWMDVFDTIFTNEIDGKNGLPRGRLTTARITDSARLLVVPGRGLKTNQAELPYLPMVEVLRPIIINKLAKLDKISERRANLIVDDAMRTFDKRVWLLMNYIVRNSKNSVEIMTQRSPSLVLESMRQLEIKGIKEDYYDLTMSVPIAILKGMNMDFDGDQTAMFMIYDKRLKKSWRFMHSPLHHFISRQTGKFNELSSFIKDTCLIMTEIWEIGKNKTYFSEWASEDELNEEINKFE